MEAQNQTYLLRLTELLDERAALESSLKAERDTSLLATAELRRENRYLRAKNSMLKEEVSATFESAKEALNGVIDTTKDWAMKAFEMLAEEDDIPRYVRRLYFQESLHKASVDGEELPVFQESSDDEEEEEVDPEA